MSSTRPVFLNRRGVRRATGGVLSDRMALDYHTSDRWQPSQSVAACAYYCGVDGTVGITDYGWHEFLLG
jgi:hypothetical protein